MALSVLMCTPDFCDIEYEINPWMHEDNPIVPSKAAQEWKDLHAIYSQQLGWDVKLADPIAGLPDMVFTANGGLVYERKVILPNFRHLDRQPETEKSGNGLRMLVTRIFIRQNTISKVKGMLYFEMKFYLLAIRGVVTNQRIKNWLILDIKVVSLQLVDERFYHLDTAFIVVDTDTVALYPKAFSEKSVEAVHKLVPHVIEANDDDALAYGLNAMSDGKNIVIPDGARQLIRQYRELGLHVVPTPIGEYQKSGGGVKCLTLELRS